ncbi:MAG: TIGR00730 family Rossman fold protein [Pseudomonadota bacterium]|nr:TIGR00730 family Rossman fold protein [Pseudomonadota bacterium]
MRRLCVFCGSASGVRPAYAASAHALVDSLARRGMGLVYGGGSVGIMGILADAALARGVPVDGVIPRHLDEREIGHKSLTRLHVVESMHERKAMMAELSDGFLALPGGIGTLEELFEVYTWGQLGLHKKPVAVLDVEGYYRPLVEFLDHSTTEGFLRPEHRAFLLAGSEVDPLLDAMIAWRPPLVAKWMELPQT